MECPDGGCTLVNKILNVLIVLYPVALIPSCKEWFSTALFIVALLLFATAIVLFFYFRKKMGLSLMAALMSNRPDNLISLLICSTILFASGHNSLALTFAVLALIDLFFYILDFKKKKETPDA